METLFFATSIAYGLAICMYLIQFVLAKLTPKLTTAKIAPNITSTLWPIFGLTVAFVSFLLNKEVLPKWLIVCAFVFFTLVTIISLFSNYLIYKKIIENTKKQ